uniref:Uncharacterized protein n=1 Tax=Trachysalambria curvirostris majanivirus TaxID=2984281 RepID=A0A9C7BMU3_9VIRU|nr:MAG: hypothetical protein [Trachysalambria curvirostris majanivirus]
MVKRRGKYKRRYKKKNKNNNKNQNKRADLNQALSEALQRVWNQEPLSKYRKVNNNNNNINNLSVSSFNNSPYSPTQFVDTSTSPFIAPEAPSTSEYDSSAIYAPIISPITPISPLHSIAPANSHDIQSNNTPTQVNFVSSPHLISPRPADSNLPADHHVINIDAPASPFIAPEAPSTSEYDSSVIYAPNVNPITPISPLHSIASDNSHNIQSNSTPTQVNFVSSPHLISPQPADSNFPTSPHMINEPTYSNNPNIVYDNHEQNQSTVVEENLDNNQSFNNNNYMRDPPSNYIHPYPSSVPTLIYNNELASPFNAPSSIPAYRGTTMDSLLQPI